MRPLIQAGPTPQAYQFSELLRKRSEAVLVNAPLFNEDLPKYEPLFFRRARSTAAPLQGFAGVEDESAPATGPRRHRLHPAHQSVLEPFAQGANRLMPAVILLETHDMDETFFSMVYHVPVVPALVTLAVDINTITLPEHGLFRHESAPMLSPRGNHTSPERV